MKFILLILPINLLLTISSAAQPKWKEIHLDNNLSFSLPSNYREVDTLGQENFYATGKSSYFQVVRIPQPQALMIKSENELAEYYKSYQKLMMAYGDRTLISDTTIKMNDLNARFFEYENYWNDSLEVEEDRIVLIGHYMYSFNFAYIKEKKTMAIPERERFLSGIRFYAAGFENQLTGPRRNKQFDEYLTFVYKRIVPVIFLLALLIWGFLRIRKN